MIGIIVVTHGNLADVLIQTCFKIIGKREKISSHSIQWEDEADIALKTIEKKVKKLDDGDGVLALTDMFGGTPTNLMISLSNKYNLEIVTGVNLPMLIKAATMQSKEIDLAEFASKIKSQGQRNIYRVAEILSMKKGNRND
ncbi:PTS system, mannose-specific IIA component [Thermotomaculum hydrothermale]|uniref:PTS system, mannose-specific IIA component n=1 Tax=Thermotomaculum hydrothermale TaxID=981385 RepID=A0A7R6PZ39_9BACT|nr:hypothetical protein [Thermotomaculum hydrothermale]BBB32308.1 PTS system, mannose-specific IIA component [Thermotomaculum hydrothermale]